MSAALAPYGAVTACQNGDIRFWSLDLGDNHRFHDDKDEEEDPLSRGHGGLSRLNLSSAMGRNFHGGVGGSRSLGASSSSNLTGELRLSSRMLDNRLIAAHKHFTQKKFNDKSWKLIKSSFIVQLSSWTS